MLNKPLAIALALFFCTATLAAQAAAAERPNIVLVMADDLGWGDPGFMGNPRVRTPHLDAMAAAGLRFDRFYAAAPVCSPTRGSCLTGRHPYRYGIVSANAGHLPAEEVTLAEVLKEQGYATGHFGKWHLGTLTKTVVESNRGGPRGAKYFSPPWESGFDVCFSTEAKVPTYDPLWRPKDVRRDTWWAPVSDLSQAERYGTNYWSNGQRVTESLRGDDSRLILDRAIPFIQDAASRNQPFFAVIWLHAPHLPVVAGADHTAMYSEFGEYEQHYYGCITALDEQVGRLRKTLRELGVAGNTLVAFCSDNGPEGDDSAPGSNGGLRGRKRSLYEGGVRVPGVIEWPARIKAGSKTSVPAVTSDYLPTVLDVLNVQLPDSRPLDGVSLLPLFEGKMRQRPSPIGFQSGGQAALIDNRYKLVRATERGKNASRRQAGYQLFDLTADPGEKHDLGDRRPEIVRQMTATLEQWQASCRQSAAGKDYP